MQGLYLGVHFCPSLQSVTTSHNKICSRPNCSPKIRLCTRALYVYRLNIGSTGVSYYLKRPGAPENIRYACHAPPILHLARPRSHRVLPCSADWLLSAAKLTYACSCHALQIQTGWHTNREECFKLLKVKAAKKLFKLAELKHIENQIYEINL